MTGPRGGARVGNVGDAQQVANAQREVRDEREVLLDSLARMLSTDHGVRVFAHLLVEFNTYGSAKSGPSSDISYNAGWQDAGHALEDLIVVAAPDAMLPITTHRLVAMRPPQPKRRGNRPPRPTDPAPPDLITEPEEVDDGN